jgi:prepilin-type processing-associated H-X9-DG protein
MIAGIAALTAVPAHAGQALEGVPAYDHVGVLVLENEDKSATWNPAGVAHYLNSLVPQGAFANAYYADGHVSLDNYITMTSGQPGNGATYSDCLSLNLFFCQQTVNTPPGNGVNIADQVEGAGKTWKEYADSTPAPCFHGPMAPTDQPPDPYQGNSTTPPAGNYADRHNPFIYYSDIVGNATRCAAHDVPFTQLATDLAGNVVPNYFFISPDTCHDGHDSPCAAGSPVPASCMENGMPASAAAGGLTSADCWLQNNLPALLQYMNSHNGLLLITSDEAGVSTQADFNGCCTGGPGGAQGFGGLVGLLALGPGVNVGFTSNHNYDHASLLRTTEDALGISTYLNSAATATAMSDLFAQPSTNTPEAPLVVVMPVLGALAAGIIWRRRRRA